jgi:hypothetical protein
MVQYSIVSVFTKYSRKVRGGRKEDQIGGERERSRSGSGSEAGARVQRGAGAGPEMGVEQE